VNLKQLIMLLLLGFPNLRVEKDKMSGFELYNKQNCDKIFRDIQKLYIRSFPLASESELTRENYIFHFNTRNLLSVSLCKSFESVPTDFKKNCLPIETHYHD